MKIRIEQAKNEPADLTVLRCFSKAIPVCNRHELLAAAEWMVAKIKDPKTKTLDSFQIEYQI
jgi:hypothetical protein